jgi:hypothetical protein
MGAGSVRENEGEAGAADGAGVGVEEREWWDQSSIRS